ncbi:DNA-binding Lrp family transcriptional regulator [Bradyrhizobium ottawaense]
MILGYHTNNYPKYAGFIPMPELDAIDRKILALLQADSRLTMQELADKVGLSVSPCHRRVKLLEERGVISRYVATVDQKALGLHVSVFISIKLARQKEEDLNRFARAISKWDEVLECYLMTAQPRLPASRRRSRPRLLRDLPQDQADPARRHRLDRVELCAEPGEVFDRSAGVIAAAVTWVQ